MARLLIVDDDADVRRMLTEYFGGHGFDVASADSGVTMRSALGQRPADVVLLDVGLPGEDGIALARFVRERYDIGIVMVTAAAEVVDRIIGLEVGADDYIAKPFDPRELLARVKSVLRRIKTRAQTPAPPDVPALRVAARPRIGRCLLDLKSRQLFDADGNDVPITAMEFDLLKAFIEHPNQVLTRDRLLTLTRNRTWEPFDRSVDIRIARLRRKVEVEPDHPLAIRTVRSAGYIFVPSV